MIPLKPLVISAPFGNYIQPKHATATLGTFTADPRPPGTKTDPAVGGRFKRVLKTVRYNPVKRQWRNRIGLRNPGIWWLMCRPIGYSKGKIISVHGFTQDEWGELFSLLSRADARGTADAVAVEINLSCPNVQHRVSLGEILHTYRYWEEHMPPVIAKLAPHPLGGSLAVAHAAWGSGVRCFHASNTLPSPDGGISGKPLKPYSLALVKALRREFPTAQIIGGGGVTCMEDVREYQRAGADHIAVASCLFFPWNIIKFARIAKKLETQL